MSNETTVEATETEEISPLELDAPNYEPVEKVTELGTVIEHIQPSGCIVQVVTEPSAELEDKLPVSEPFKPEPNQYDYLLDLDYRLSKVELGL